MNRNFILKRGRSVTSVIGRGERGSPDTLLDLDSVECTG